MTSLKTAIVAGLGAVAMLGAATAVSATDFHPGDPEFNVTFHTDGTISASFGVHGITGPTFDDSYLFTIPTGENGYGSGSVTTTANNISLSTFTDITSVTVNGISAIVSQSTPDANGNGWIQTWSITNVPITVGELNTIRIIGTTNPGGNANGSYGGQATFTPTVPEPATWAMLIVGFGLVGVARRRRTSKAVHA